MHARSVLVDAVLDRVGHDGGHGSQEGQRAPESVVGRQVSRVQLARLPGVESL